MQSLVINARTGPITAKLFVTLHNFTQEGGKGCASWATAPPHQTFPGIPTPLHHHFHNTLSYRHVLILTSRLLLISAQDAKANSGLSLGRNAMHQGWMFSCIPVPWCWTPGVFFRQPAKQEGNSIISALTANICLQSTIWFCPTAVRTWCLSQTWA